MSRIAYVNGRYTPHSEACVHVEDRGYQFSDGVYEVCEIRDGHLIDETRHLVRLERSLDELRIARPMTRAALKCVLREVLRRNRVRDGIVYLQVTRGVSRRDHIFPPTHVTPAVVVTARSLDPSRSSKAAEQGISVITLPDNRWDRVDIKAVSLLPNVLAKQAAKEAGAKEAWFVDADGYVTEGASTNAWIVTPDGELVTRPAEQGILRGVTRTTLIDVLEKKGLRFVERPFTVEEAKKAREAFITAATQITMPVVRIDDTMVADGKPGPVTQALRAVFHDVAERLPI
ncbi:D-amino-acid transaminase [Agaricicola taiwanensis]|uniref:Probable branched-chain-amino-acid aminotransferase n=1 Tax=Agaricicola taiwanensis TaxID=591372 RepID=A0A8J3DVR8_9RHOB|nr:D-amino-acid transaminase [Agaricicola taiwanensis]GGE45472.1 D-amino-acid transaminase [Agaricicola taiwanensis]